MSLPLELSWRLRAQALELCAVKIGRNMDNKFRFAKGHYESTAFNSVEECILAAEETLTRSYGGLAQLENCQEILYEHEKLTHAFEQLQSDAAKDLAAAKQMIAELQAQLSASSTEAIHD